jgi:hypothetical protein
VTDRQGRTLPGRICRRSHWQNAFIYSIILTAFPASNLNEIPQGWSEFCN